MTRTHIPDEVLSAAHARSRARAVADWPEADRLRAVIEAAGWVVVDRGTDFALTPAAPPDVVEGDRIRYGASRSVPSRLDAAPDAPATVVLVATDRAEGLAVTHRALRATVPPGTTFVIVADAPSDEQTNALETLEALDGPSTEIVWTSRRLGPAVSRNAGIRRARGSIVILLDGAIEPEADVVAPVIDALADPSIAIVGGAGLVTPDLRSFSVVGPGDADAVGGAVVAFRRADAADRGPLEERFEDPRSLDLWWSLVLRDEGEGSRPRRAVVLGGLPTPLDGLADAADGARRLPRRDFYRLHDRFGWRRDLLAGPAENAPR